MLVGLPSDKWARAILWAGCLASLLLLIYGCRQNPLSGTKAFAVYALLPVGLLAAFAFAQSRSASHRKQIASLVCSMVVAAYSGEACLTLLFMTDSVDNLADRQGVKLDTRSHIQIANELREKGKRAFPYGTFVNLDLQGKSYFPLTGTVARAETVYCNETGPWQSFQSDRYGFRNPDEVWDVQPEIALIGDSFVLGQAADTGKEFAALIRAQVPQTLALGKNGLGPLGMLGVVREYLADRRPKKVLWVFNEGNDIADLRWEQEVPELRGYLQADYSQNLRDKTAVLNAEMEKVAWSKLSTEPAKAQEKSFDLAQIKDFLMLRATRSLLPIKASSERFDRELFRTILGQAKREVSQWGGELIFVYLPDINSFRRNPKISLGKYHDEILAMAGQVGLPVIDLREGFNQHPDPESLYWFRVPGTHFTDEGNRQVAKIILQSL